MLLKLTIFNDLPTWVFGDFKSFLLKLYWVKDLRTIKSWQMILHDRAVLVFKNLERSDLFALRNMASKYTGVFTTGKKPINSGKSWETLNNLIFLRWKSLIKCRGFPRNIQKKRLIRGFVSAIYGLSDRGEKGFPNKEGARNADWQFRL